MNILIRNLSSNLYKQWAKNLVNGTTVATMSTQKNVRVSVAQGTVVGLQDTLPNGQAFYSFKGIPYAQPPINDLRFKSPVPMDTFPEPLLDCTEERSVSYQKDTLTAQMVGSEDCLFLNVYTPTPVGLGTTPRDPLPVMLWIHGGAFMSGSGNSDYYSPEYLLQEGVIVVTCNYRLGPFGFLCLPDAGIPGNAGIKDQLLVLKWVNKNISQFGGDPNNVTMFGESAGGSSVYLHALSEQSKPYISKAICQSGTSLMEWAIQTDPVGKTRRLAAAVGCPETETKSQADILEYLRGQSTAALYSKMLPTLDTDERRRGLPIPFKPCLERDEPGAFLTRPILELLENPSAVTVPLMIGYNSAEGLMMIDPYLKRLDMIDRDLARMIPRSLAFPNETVKKELAAEDSVTSAMRQRYFGGRPVDQSTLNEFVNLHTDYHFAIHSVITAELHARNQHQSPLHFYRFSFDGDFNLFKKNLLNKWNATAEQMPGACHVDEVFYLFNLKMLKGQRDPSSASTAMSKIMCKLWTNYAKYGDPTPDAAVAGAAAADQLPFKWLPVGWVDKRTTAPVDIDYLKIDKRIEMCRNPDSERIDFWKEQYRRWNGDFLKPKL